MLIGRHNRAQFMRVAVLGAGLQGACVALELSVHGVEVDLYEKRDYCLSQTLLS